MTDQPSLFKCYGISYCHTLPEHQYPFTRCFGFRALSEIDYGRYYDDAVSSSSQKRYTVNYQRNQQTNRQDTGSTIEIYPNTIVHSIGPALTPSLSPNVPFSNEPSPNPRFPRPPKTTQRREDICIGVMTIGLESNYPRCKGVGVEILFEDSNNDDTYNDSSIDGSEKKMPPNHINYEKYNQEMMPPTLEDTDDYIYEESHDIQDHSGESVHTSSWNNSQFQKEQVQKNLRSAITSVPHGLWKVGERAAILLHLSSSALFALPLSNPKALIKDTYNRLFDIEEKSIQICRRSWVSINKWFGKGSSPPTA